MIEVLVVIAIFSALFAMSAFFYITFYRSSNFNVDVDAFVTVLQRARGKAMSNTNQFEQGVYIDSARYVLFQGNAYGVNPSLNQDISRNSVLTFNGAPGSGIIFSRLSGDSNFEGNIIITDGFKTATVSINYEGQIKR